MGLALVCLWLGFAIGFIVAAVLRGGSRDEARPPVVGPTRATFEVSRVRPARRKAAAPNASAHIDTVE